MIVGRPAISGRHRSSGTYPLASASAAIAGANAPLTKRCIEGGARKLVVEMEQFRADAKKAPLDVLIQRDVRATEAIDRLLRVTDEE